MPIEPIGDFRIAGAAPEGVEKSGGQSFAEQITKVLREVNQDQVDAQRKIADLVVHEKGSIQEAMFAMSDAEGSFRMVMEMRNRLIEAVNRLLRAQG